MEDFRFSNETPIFRLDEIVEYLTGPRLFIPKTDYPNILDWSQKVYSELKTDLKRVMVAYYGREIVGVTVYQKHRTDDSALEIKNLTVRPDMRGRHVASFLLRNSEVEGAREYGVDKVICDAKANNFGVRGFLLSEHYQILRQTDLYGLGAGEDLIFHKKLFIPNSRKSIFRID